MPPGCEESKGCGVYRRHISVLQCSQWTARVSHTSRSSILQTPFYRFFIRILTSHLHSLSATHTYAKSKNRPYIKWFLDNCGHTGLNKMLDGFEDRTAYAQTIVAYTTGPDAEIRVFDGRTDGKIVTARGPTDFGWDPVFEPNEGHGKTYAEMSKDFKNTISHRGRSFEKFRTFLMKA
jgi:hypothetical protein